MKVKFLNPDLSDIFQGIYKGKPLYSKEVIKKFIQKVQMVQFVDSIIDLYKSKGLHFEKLQNGYHSIRVNEKYRVIFLIEKDDITVEDIIVIEDLSNHYGDN